MKKYITLLIILIAVAVVIFGSVYAYDKITNENNLTASSFAVKSSSGLAQDFTVYNYDRKEFSLAQMQGKATVVNFWASWCPPCVGELPHFNSLYNYYKDSVNFMMVNTEDASQMDNVAAFISDNGYSFPVYYDLDYSGTKAYSINAIPVTLFIDKDGNLIEKQVGAMDEETIREYIEEILK